MPAFDYNGFRIHYEEYGPGERPIVLIHGLLMNGHMYDRVAPMLAERGNRVITLDLLGHGQSDRPTEMYHYSMFFFAEQVVALLDHLGLKQAVIGGTSLGANVALETARMAPKRVKGMMIEMPVLDNALLGAAMVFTPILFGLRFAAPMLKRVASLTNRIPRSNFLLDIALDWLRREPEASTAVLEGVLSGGAAPHHNLRVKMEQPTLIIGHRADPLHPLSDSGMLHEELRNSRLVQAHSPLEWRVNPERLTDELARFLDEVFSESKGLFASLAGRDGQSPGRERAPSG